MPLLKTTNVLDALPHDCTAIAVDLLDDAESLPDFVHPDRAFYVFGGEDKTLGPEIIARCATKVMVPTAYCMNLAAAVNVVLYDRLCKRRKD